MKNTQYFLLVSLVLALFLSACGGETAPEPTPIDPAAIFTAAAETVAAQLTETAVAFSPTPEALPTEAGIPATVTLVALPSIEPLNTPIAGFETPTFAVGIPTLIPTATQIVIQPTLDGPICDNMIFVADINYADGTIVPPGYDFEKIWRIQNTGTCTWDDGYQLVLVSGGSTLDAHNIAWQLDDIGEFTSPGETLDVGAKLTTPLSAGEYTNCFAMQNDRGYYFGGWLCVIVEVTGD